jgi:hypothetical protein
MDECRQPCKLDGLVSGIPTGVSMAEIVWHYCTILFAVIGSHVRYCSGLPTRFDLAAKEEKREAAKLEQASWLTSELDRAAPSSTTLAALTMPLDHQQLSYKD